MEHKDIQIYIISNTFVYFYNITIVSQYIKYHRFSNIIKHKQKKLVKEKGIKVYIGMSNKIFRYGKFQLDIYYIAIPNDFVTSWGQTFFSY